MTDENCVFIDNNEQLINICSHLSSEDYISIDTEFYRKTSYNLKCCLIQFASTNFCCIIDPYAVDVSIFNKAINNLCKIFHDSKQDIECLEKFGDIESSSVFDTQTAELFITFSQTRPSYKSLVKKYCGITIDKSMTLSNWRHRPINPKQIMYAITDVKYLHDIYKQQIKILQLTKRFEICKEFTTSEILKHNNKINRNLSLEPKQVVYHPLLNLLKTLLYIKCKSENISPLVIASADTIQKFLLKDENLSFNTLQQQIFIDDAIALINGELSITTGTDLEPKIIKL